MRSRTYDGAFKGALFYAIISACYVLRASFVGYFSFQVISLVFVIFCVAIPNYDISFVEIGHIF